jgi:CheY-like chemotaxis protein
MVSHDLKTPLNSIYLIAQRLLEQSGGSEDSDTIQSSPNQLQLAETDGNRREQRELINMITYSCKILSNIIKDILFSSKLDSGSLSLDKVRFSIKKSIEQVVLISSVTALKKGLDVALLVDVSRQAIKLPTVIYGDVSKFQQILTNIMGNAIKFTEKGSVTVRVSIKEKSNNEIKVLFAIKDTGIGISKSKQPQLFKMFSRVHEDRKFEGTGLGLAICKNLVNLMSGEIGVKSRVGEGSEFWFSIVFQTSREKERHRFPSNGSIDVPRKNSAPVNQEQLLQENVQATTNEEQIHIEDERKQSLGYESESTDDASDSSASTAYFEIFDFVNRHMKGTIMLIIYSNEIVRDITRRYMVAFGVECVFIKNTDAIMSNAENLRTALQETFYGTSAENASISKRSKWPVQKPISTVLIDDVVLLAGTSLANETVINKDVDPNNLFNATEYPKSPNRKMSIAEPIVRRTSVTHTFDRIFKLSTKLRVMIHNHNLKCEGELFPRDKIIFTCAYHQFDVHRFHQSIGAEDVFQVCFRKPLMLSTVETMFRDMITFTERKPEVIRKQRPRQSFLNLPPTPEKILPMHLQPRKSMTSLPPRYPRSTQVERKSSQGRMSLEFPQLMSPTSTLFADYKFPPTPKRNGTTPTDPTPTLPELVDPIIQTPPKVEQVVIDREVKITTIVADDNSINKRIVLKVVKDCSCTDANTTSPMYNCLKKNNLTSLVVNAVGVDNGQQVLDAIGKSTAPVDLVFVDVHMDVMNGIECTKIIRSNESSAAYKATIVGVTGDEQVQSQCLEAGMDFVIFKPVSSKQLREVVEKVVTKKAIEQFN